MHSGQNTDENRSHVAKKTNGEEEGTDANKLKITTHVLDT